MKYLLFIILTICTCSVVLAENDIESAISFFEQGEYDKAKSIFNRDEFKQNATALLYLGLIHDPEFNKIPFAKHIPAYDKKNDKATVMYYQEAIQNGSAYAGYYLGRYFQTLSARRQQWKRGEKIWRKSLKPLKDLSEDGDWLAKYMLADIYSGKFKNKQYVDDALETLYKEARDGNTQAQFYLGKSLSHWFICRTDECIDYVRAYAWFGVSASQGSAHAFMYMSQIKKRLDEKEIIVGDKLLEEYFKKYRKPDEVSI